MVFRDDPNFKRRFMGIEIIYLENDPVVAVRIGSVTDTLAGKISPALKERHFFAKDYSYRRGEL